MSREASMSTSVQSWLGHELEVRGIDAMIYTRYILSILQQDSVEVDYQDPFHSPKKREPVPSVRKPKSKTKKVDKKSDKRKSVEVDPDQVKKSAAVECLLSVTDQDSDIENLIEELCVKLKQQSSLKKDVASTPTPSKNEVIAASPGDPKEKYFAAFPSLSGKEQQGSAFGVVWKKGKAKLWSEKVGNKEDGLGNLSDSRLTNSTKTEKNRKEDSRGKPEAKRCKSADGTSNHSPVIVKSDKSIKPGVVKKEGPVGVGRKPAYTRKQLNENKNYSVQAGNATEVEIQSKTKSRRSVTPQPKHGRFGRHEISRRPFDQERRGKAGKHFSSSKTNTWPLHGKQKPSFIVPKFRPSSGHSSPLSASSSKTSSEDESGRRTSPYPQHAHVPKKGIKQTTAEKAPTYSFRPKRSVTPELQEDYGWYVKPLDEMFRHSPTPNTIRLYNRGLTVHHEEPYRRSTPEVGLDLVALFEESQEAFVESNNELPSQSRFLKLFENASKTDQEEPVVLAEEAAAGKTTESSPDPCHWFLSQSESSDENSCEEPNPMPELVRTEDVLLSPGEEVFWDNESLGYASQEDGVQPESPLSAVGVIRESMLEQKSETESSLQSLDKNVSTLLSDTGGSQCQLTQGEPSAEKISSGTQSHTEDYNNNESSNIDPVKETLSSDSFWPLELITGSSIWSPLAVNGITTSSYPWGSSNGFSDHHGLFTASNMFSGLNLELSFGESVFRSMSTHRFLHDGYSEGLCLEMDCMNQSSYPWMDSISSLISPRRAPGQDTFQLWDVNSHRPFNFEGNAHNLWVSNGILSFAEDWSAIRSFPDLGYGILNGEQTFINGGVYGNVPTDSLDNIWSIRAVGETWGNKSSYVDNLSLSSSWDKDWFHSALVNNLEELENDNSEDLSSDPPVGRFRARSISVDSALCTYASCSGDTGTYSYFGASEDPTHRPLHHVFSESEIFRGSAFRRYRRGSDFYSQLNQQHLKLLTHYRRNVAAAVAAATIAKNVTPPLSGEVEEENLFFSPKTHFRPIQTPRTESLENDSSSNTQVTSPTEEANEEESAADSYGSNYQVYLGDEVSQENGAEFVPKFKIQRDNNKSAQTDSSCSCDNLRDSMSDSRQQLGMCHKLGNNTVMTSIEEEGGGAFEKLMSHLDKENLDSQLPYNHRTADNQREVDSPVYVNCSSQIATGAVGDQTRLWSGHIFDIASSLRELWITDDEIDVLSLCQMHNTETSQEEGGERIAEASLNPLTESGACSSLPNSKVQLLAPDLGASSSSNSRLGTDFQAGAKLETEIPAVKHVDLSPYDNLSCDFAEDRCFDHSQDSVLPTAPVESGWNPWSADSNCQQQNGGDQNSEPVQYLFLVNSTSNLWKETQKNDCKEKCEEQTGQGHCLSESWHPGGQSSSVFEGNPGVPKIHFGSWQSSGMHDTGKYHWSTEVDNHKQRKDSCGKPVKQRSTKPWKELIQDDEEEDSSGEEIPVTSRRVNNKNGNEKNEQDDDVFTDNTADFLLQMFPLEIVDSVPMPSHAQVLYSSDLEEQWRTSGKHFEVQKPRKDKSGPRKKPCSFFLEGHCRRADCKFSHDLTQITCRFWEEGCCFKGLTCPFLHGYQR
ncbi:uncharacterized protein LOC106156599 [Lingula anatina]|uniref:Uncharacterized protein LOC106156599 n=1 Tax=Lingula anatina TaxID=7574 RepID=A0A1S3HMX9_LINAN|nr:uncharacterized protein LOC106156599 [Lingula anatina]|eukprot:XP_013387382.1 uncharacterized protein LOC106156599 [Lingula anatina]